MKSSKKAVPKETEPSINVAARKIELVYVASKGSYSHISHRVKLLTMSRTHFTARPLQREDGWLNDPERWPISGEKSESLSGWSTFFRFGDESKKKIAALHKELFGE